MSAFAVAVSAGNPEDGEAAEAGQAGEDPAVCTLWCLLTWPNRAAGVAEDQGYLHLVAAVKLVERGDRR
jgi:hypothetical protein